MTGSPQGHESEDSFDHDTIARWERLWLNAAGLLLVLFVMLIAYSLATEGGHIAQRSGRTTPDNLANLELFKEPGVTITRYGAGVPTEAQVTLIAQAWSFSPAEIIVPQGAKTTFYMTSRDVLHGFQVEDTTINVELIPGEISTFSYTFDKPGVYRTTCNEYCGLSHQNMLGTVRVLAPGELEEETAAAVPADDLGASTYAANCASCHQASGEGVLGAFPPLAGHAAELLEADRNYLPKVLLYGLQGEITVGGERYNGQMPAWQQLSDEAIAQTLNTVVAWDNEGDRDPYTAQEIATARQEPLEPEGVYTLRQALALE
jgi:cytochrome c oxidase subunit 2